MACEVIWQRGEGRGGGGRGVGERRKAEGAANCDGFKIQILYVLNFKVREVSDMFYVIKN